MSGLHFSEEAITPAVSQTTNGGVYSIRHRRESARIADNESIYSETEDLKREGDFKKRQEFKGAALLWLSWQATGLNSMQYFCKSR